MKLLRVISTYPSLGAQFYAQRPGMAEQDFATQKAALDSDRLGFGSSLSLAMKTLGYEVIEIYPNLEPFQRAWARAQGLDNGLALQDLLIAHAKTFQPEIVFYECFDFRLLQELRNKVGSIKFVLGWQGSAVRLGRVCAFMDAILSCAPETVDYFRHTGIRSELLDHAFDSGINGLLVPTQEPIPISFIGSIIRRNQFHLERERILLEMVGHVPLQIFSPSMDIRWHDYFKAAAVGGAYLGMKAMSAIKVNEYATRHSRLARKVARVASAPRLPVNAVLANYSRAGVYGIEFYQVIRDSLVSLNIHADSSPNYASNMRLFEATGVGSCLLTDWKSNLPGLFEIDEEVVTYRSSAEAGEKAQWLLDHPQERAEIARRGQARTLRDYTCERQATRLNEIIKGLILQA